MQGRLQLCGIGYRCAGWATVVQDRLQLCGIGYSCAGLAMAMYDM